ncbi:MAG: hypothetical protein K9J37_11855 [Saprospiraceae bacterium]|nr:hypothetical protein [Saprospiraceae bacterium]MCF8250602.1 hypothetical protein [Saprospiraceae bacterium]MCF8281419.1 hypothetical protein [Bacteroidales bacterium]MCF8313078.1 hypothetical protein [Saprospiraceae bacterium]MCF8441557.1 hypothetical protein [Saprospiraceae bacterium]
MDTLEKKLSETYKPGFGEFMSNIQVHHEKLWFAGQYQIWKLADFEIHEIMEIIEDIETYLAEREESKQIGMINPAIDSLTLAIQAENLPLFKSSFVNLTNTCNNCHRAVDFVFNKVKLPETPPFSNQDFSVQK